MSEWYETENDDIDIDFKQNEVNIYVTNNDFGAIYKTITFEQIAEIIRKVGKHGNKQTEMDNDVSPINKEAI